MEGPEQPLTRAGARAWAVAQVAARGDDPARLVEVEHDALSDSEHSGGYAHRHGRVLYVALRDGSFGTHLDPGDEPGRAALLDRVLERARLRNRTLRPTELGVHQQAVLAALRRGVRRVAALPERERPGVGPVELPGAEWLLMTLRRASPTGAPTAQEALRTLAGSDELLAPPDPGAVRAHPCPLCRGLAPWTERYPAAVCADCGATTRCRHHRLVAGRNTSWNGGFEAVHRDDGSVCDDATAGGGVTVAGLPCRMGEARFGGVVVEAVAQLPDPRDDLAVLGAARTRADLVAEVTGLPAPPLPSWAGGPVADGDVAAHLAHLTDHLLAAAAAAWCRDHPGPGQLGDLPRETAVRRGLALLVDPALAP